MDEDLVVRVFSDNDIGATVDEPLAEHTVSVADRVRFLAELEDWLGEWS